MSWRRLHVPQAKPGQEQALPELAAHHARDVLRLREQDELRVFDGQGREYQARVLRVRRREVRIQVEAEVAARPESPLHIELCLSPLKGDRFEWAIEKATELGVSSVTPLLTQRSEAFSRAALEGARLERWQRVAISAAEQCGRAVVPRVSAGRRLADLLFEPFAGDVVLLAETPPSSPLASCLTPGRLELRLLVGPAGGFTAEERSAAHAAGCRAASLGPRILRAETAAVAAVVLLQAAAGDL